ncbi:MAG: Abi family protein [Clostridia bacterium]|nr:Abi family protein [Clostridia bacterium]
MSNKGFKTIAEQISILKSRGLIIEDEDKAAEFLRRNNYYRISGYSLTLRSHDVFSPKATFQNIMDIYEFDHELRHVLLKYIEIIEISVKSIYSHEFTKLYGATGYLDATNFTNESIYSDIMQKAEAQKVARLPHEAYLKHFINELHEDIPLWAYVDLLTISNISFLYKISPLDVKNTTANALGLNKKGTVLLEKFMHQLTIIRNLCAHGSRLYNRLFEQRPTLNKSELALLRTYSNGTVDNAHLYGFILIMRRLLKPDEFSEMIDEIVLLTEKYPFVHLKYYGFREDWQKALK